MKKSRMPVYLRLQFANNMPEKMQVIYSVVVMSNIRISSLPIQTVYGFDTCSHPVSGWQSAD
jgi:hypothetical protein